MNTETHFGNYRILEKLGQGVQATTYLCEAPDCTKVTLKQIDLANVDPWGYAEVFDREVSVIRELDHPYLPKYIVFSVISKSRLRLPYRLGCISKVNRSKIASTKGASFSATKSSISRFDSAIFSNFSRKEKSCAAI